MAGLGCEHLPERGQHLARAGTGHVGGDRHLAPAEDGEALVGENLVDALGRGVGVVGREEGNPGGVLAHRRQLEGHDRAVETVGHLDEDPGTVAGVGLGAGRAAVIQVAERRERLVDQRAATCGPACRRRSRHRNCRARSEGRRAPVQGADRDWASGTSPCVSSVMVSTGRNSSATRAWSSGRGWPPRDDIGPAAERGECTCCRPLSRTGFRAIF